MFDSHYGSIGYDEMILEIAEDSTINIASRRFKYFQGEYRVINDFFYGGRSLKLGALLMDFLTYDFESYNGFVSFIEKYGISGLGSLSKSIQAIKSSMSFSDETKSNKIIAAWNESKDILTKAQRYFSLAVYYCLDLKSEKCLNELNSRQRFYLLNSPDIYEELNQIISVEKMSEYESDLRIVFFTDSEQIYKTKLKDLPQAPRDIEEAAEIIKGFEFKSKKSYHSSNIISMLYVEFVELVNNDTPVKKCECCGYYFIPENKIDTEFCNRVVKYVNGIGRTCKEVGPKERYRKNRSKEELNLLFDKKYKTLYARINSNGKKSITCSQFDFWRDEAKKRLDVAKSGTDKEKDEFKEWLEDSCKIEWFNKIKLEVK